MRQFAVCALWAVLLALVLSESEPSSMRVGLYFLATAALVILELLQRWTESSRIPKPPPGR